MASANSDKESDDGPDNEGTAHEKTKPIEGSRMYSSGDVHLVVIDDDPAVGRLVQATLEGNEFNLEIVSDPNKVEPVLRKQTYHVVILDYVLPGLESADVLSLVQETQPDASIIVVTAFPSIDSALQCLRAHTYDY